MDDLHRKISMLVARGWRKYDDHPDPIILEKGPWFILNKTSMSDLVTLNTAVTIHNVWCEFEKFGLKRDWIIDI